MEKYKKLFYGSLTILAILVILMIVVKIFFSVLGWAIRITGALIIVFVAIMTYFYMKSRINSNMK